MQMATAVSSHSCFFSALSSTVVNRYTVSSGSCLATSQIPVGPGAPRAVKQISRPSSSLRRSSSSKFSSEKNALARRKFPGRSKDKSPHEYADQQTKSFGLQSKEKDFSFDLEDEQDEPRDIRDSDFLNAVVKVYSTHTEPDYSLPWQKQRQYTSTGSAFMIGGRRLLTNAHCVEHCTQVKVKRRGDDRKYVAKVLAIGVECDIALLSVENVEFWRQVKPLKFGQLPDLQDAVTVVGYPFGGDTISVTKGVVSRIEVTSYAHGSCDLLGIQIDAAINPGNSGGPAFNDKGECIGMAFQVYRDEEAENIGYVIPTPVVSHFLNDYEKNGKYTGFPSFGVMLQKLENPALRACLKVPSNEGVLVRRIKPTSDAHNVLKKGDVIVSFDDVHVGVEGTVPFRSNERIAFCYLVSQKFVGDVVEVGIIREGRSMKVNVILNRLTHLVPDYFEGGQPSYFIVGGLVFTPLSEPLIEEEGSRSFGVSVMAKARCAMARFKEEQIVILLQVLADDCNIGYESMCNLQVLKFNGTRIKNIHHLAHLVDSCKDKYLVFEFELKYILVLEREAATRACPYILEEHGISSDRNSKLLEPYVDSTGDNLPTEHEFGEIDSDGLLWA